MQDWEDALPLPLCMWVCMCECTADDAIGLQSTKQSLASTWLGTSWNCPAKEGSVAGQRPEAQKWQVSQLAFFLRPQALLGGKITVISLHLYHWHLAIQRIKLIIGRRAGELSSLPSLCFWRQHGSLFSWPSEKRPCLVHTSWRPSAPTKPSRVAG